MDKIKILNRIIIFILILLIIFFKVDKKMYIIIFSWILNVLVIYNVQKINNEKYEKVLTFVRRTIYLCPLIVPLFFINEPLKCNLYWLDIFIGILIGILFIGPEITTYQLFLSKSYIELVGKEAVYEVCANCYSLILGAICEEIYFKWIIINTLKLYFGIGSIIISSYLFFLHHYLTKKFDKFSKKDFYIQIIFSIITGGLYYTSNSVVLAIISHLTFNFPLIIFQIKRGIVK